MTAVYLDHVKIYANLTAGWTDISAYVLLMEDLTAEWGMTSNDPVRDWLAGVGSMRFTINNASGYFTPGGPSMLAGWGKGVEVYLELNFENRLYKRFRGRVTGIQYDPELWGGRERVTVSDWMDTALNSPLVTPAIGTDQTEDQVITTIVDAMAIQPQNRDFDTGAITFPFSFDSTTRKTTAYREINSANNSEAGRVYLVKDSADGETLVMENHTARYGWRDLDTVTYPTDDGATLLKNDGGNLLLVSGGKILLNHTTAVNADFDNTILERGLKIRYGEDMINYITLTAYPASADASPVVLFTLNEPVPIASGQTIIISGSYANPSGGAPVNGKDMITPAATTDYLANTTKGGGGTNITDDIVVTPAYYSATFEHSVYNGNAASGWVNFFQCQGTGIYRDNPISEIVQDAVSVEARGEQTATLDQKYNKNLTEGEWIAKSIVEQNKDPLPVISEISYCANTSRALMYFFLNIDAGWLIRLQTTQAGTIDKWFYVQKVKNRIKAENVFVSYILQEALSLQS